MSNTSQKKVDEKTLKDVQAKLIEKGKAAGGSLTTEEFAAAMAPLGADMDQIEESKVAIRNIRRDAMDTIKAMKKKSEITEDEQKVAEKDLQKVTDDYVKKVDEMAAKKEKELMEL